MRCYCKESVSSTRRTYSYAMVIMNTIIFSTSIEYCQHCCNWFNSFHPQWQPRALRLFNSPEEGKDATVIRTKDSESICYCSGSRDQCLSPLILFHECYLCLNWNKIQIILVIEINIWAHLFCDMNIYVWIENHLGDRWWQTTHWCLVNENQYSYVLRSPTW